MTETINYILKEPVSEDLEQAANKYGKEETILPEGYNDGDIPDYEEQTADAFKAGAQWQREQMMKDAIDSQVKWCNHGYPDVHMEDLAVLDDVQLPKDKFKIGDKVKVIIIKE